MPSEHIQEIQWTGPAQSSVIATGDFDGWKGTTLLSKNNNNNNSVWSATVKVPFAEGNDKQIRYKFVVDGTWLHAQDQPVSDDGSGNVNNYFTVPTAPVQQAAPEKETPVPEAAQSSSTQAEPTAAVSEVASAPAHQDAPISAPSDNAQAGTPVPEITTSQEVASTPNESGAAQDLPTSLSQLLGANDANANGNGNGGAPDFSSIAGMNGQNFVTYSMSNFTSIKYLEVLRKAYPSKYLLQVDQPSIPENESFIPSDVVLGCEYLLTKHRMKVTSGNVGGPDPALLKVIDKIKKENTQWSFSEKRLKKLIKDNNNNDGVMEESERILRLAGLIGGGKNHDLPVPVSRMDPHLVSQLAKMSPATAAASAAHPTKALPAPTSPEKNGGSDKENSLPVPNTSSSSSSSSKKKGSKKPKSSSTAPAATLTETVTNAASSALETISSVLPSSVLPSSLTSTDSSKDVVVAAQPEEQGEIGLKWINDTTGRGIVSNRDFSKGSVIFREEAFAFSPTKNIQAAINEGQACGYCGKLFLGKAAGALVVPCVSHEGLSGEKSGLEVPKASANANGVRKVSGGRRPLPPSVLQNSKKQQQQTSSSSSAAAKPASTAAAGNATKSTEESAANAIAAIDAHLEKQAKKGKCTMKFCNKLCRDRCNETYANLLCPVVNPSYPALLQWAESVDPKNGKQNVLGVFRILLCLIVSSQRDGFESLYTTPNPSAPSTTANPSSTEVYYSGKQLLDRIECLTAINERTRRNREQGVLADLQFASEWIDAFRLVYEALQLPQKYYSPLDVPAPEAAEGESKDEGEKPKYPGQTIQRPTASNALPEWLTSKDLPQELADKILGFDNFLVWLGRVALNQEDDGGIYLCHPCLNHSCEANAIVKRTPSLVNAGAREAKPSRIYVVATKDIKAGEEITITYISADAPVEVRRHAIRANYLFDCHCPRCESQMAEIEANRPKQIDQGSNAGNTAQAETKPAGEEMSSERARLEEVA